VEVLSRAERRRSWTLEQKREIVSESLGSELTPTEVARKHGISTGQIYTWRHQLLTVRGTTLLQAPQFASVELTPSPGATSLAAAAAATSSPATGLIEIVLPGGALVRVDAHVDGRALRRVLGALSER
jgi:transposase